MATDNWSTVGKEYSKMLIDNRVSLCLPNTQDLVSMGVNAGNTEVLQQRRAKVLGSMKEILSPNSRFLKNDLRSVKEPDDGESIVIYPYMPASEENQLVLLDRYGYYRRGEYLPNKWVDGIIEIEVAKRLIRELTKVWGVIPRRFLFNRTLLPAIVKNLNTK